MNDPYSVLGVSPDATEHEIKKAYRELVRKYHPDNYHDNPLSDLASEKMKEINEAYNTVLQIREGKRGYNPGGSRWGDSGYQPGAGYSGSSSSAEGAKVRAAINTGDVRLAEELLKGFSSRNAEWNFLMGSLCYRKGWLDDALSYFQTAASMEPDNAEYKQALGFMNQGGQAYRPYGRGQATHQGCDACDVCTAMMCMNLCCRCG